MTSHHQPDLRQQFIRSINELAGLSLVMPEPEVLDADLARIRCKTLADCIAHLIAEHEPMLKAEADGASVVVGERGGKATMRFTIEAI